MLLDEEHPVDADRLLVVTFSNAAAREMRQRIDARLAQEQAARPYSQHLRRQRFLMERAHISTIHAFCLDLSAATRRNWICQRILFWGRRDAWL